MKIVSRHYVRPGAFPLEPLVPHLPSRRRHQGHQPTVIPAIGPMATLMPIPMPTNAIGLHLLARWVQRYGIRRCCRERPTVNVQAKRADETERPIAERALLGSDSDGRPQGCMKPSPPRISSHRAIAMCKAQGTQYG
jgi:hypothetical protein